MCPVIPLFLLLLIFIFLVEAANVLTVNFSPSVKWMSLKEGENGTVYFSVNNTLDLNESHYNIFSEQPDIADVIDKKIFINVENETLNGSFVISGKFLGVTQVKVIRDTGENVNVSDPFIVKILKVKGDITRAFTYCVIFLMSLNYINMGCALDLKVVMGVLRKPISPCVGLFCQFVIMPLVSYGLALLLFDDKILRLGLFVFGCSPGGGASNMWTVLLKGNLNLSLTMTFISNLCALGMIPLWLFTLGRALFSEMEISVPYKNVFYTLGGMVVTLGIGLLIQKYKPNVARVCSRMLARVCMFFIVVIVIFGTYANFYMFRLFTWRIVVAACFNVWLGFVFGAITSKVFKLSMEDSIAVAIETGVQNTGIAFVLLNVSLTPPESDLAGVVPIASSIVTPIPLLLVYLFQKLYAFIHKKSVRGKPIVLYIDDTERQALPSPNSTSESLNGSKLTSFDH